MMRILSRFGILLGLVLPIGLFTAFITGKPVAGLITAAAATMAWVAPESTLLAFIALAPICRSPKSEIISNETLMNMKMLLAIILGFIWWLRFGLSNRKEELPNWLLIILTGWGTLSMFSTVTAKSWEAAAPHLAACVGGVVLFFIVWHCDDRLRRKIAFTIALSAFAVSIISVLQYAMLRYHILPGLWNYVLSPTERLYILYPRPAFEPDVARVSGTYIHLNALGTFFYMLIPFACASINIKSLSTRHRIFLSVLSLAMLAGLYATNSRSGVVGTAIALTYLALHRGYRWLVTIGALSLLAVLVFFAYDSDRFVDYFRTISRVEYGLSSRHTIWGNALELCERYPLLGVGPGNLMSQYVAHFGFFVFDNQFENEQLAYDFQIQGDDLTNNFHSHNTSLQVVGEYGLLGLPLFFAGIISVIWGAEKRAKNLPLGSFGRTMALATASFCVAYLVASNFDSYVSFTQMGLMLTAPPMVALGLRSI